MAIYVNNNVVRKENAYVNFLMRMCGYFVNEAITRIWEIEYQIIRRCNPILMKPNTSGIIKFKSVLQRQEIKRLAGNISQLTKIVNRRKGNRTNTQWLVEYYVSVSGDIFILKLDCYNTFSEDINNDIIIDTMKTNKKVIRITESDLHNIINEAVKEALNELDPRTYASAAEKAMIKSNGIGDKNYNRINKFRQAAIDAWNRDFGEEWDEDFPTQYGMGQDKGKIRLHYNSENGTYEPSQERTIWTPNANGEDDVISDITTPSRGRDVAHQMNFPSKAKYVKGKGW